MFVCFIILLFLCNQEISFYFDRAAQLHELLSVLNIVKHGPLWKNFIEIFQKCFIGIPSVGCLFGDWVVSNGEFSVFP